MAGRGCASIGLESVRPISFLAKRVFTRQEIALTCSQNLQNIMRIPFSVLALLIALTMFSAGCAGPEKKFGRGLNNVTEFARLGEMRRSMEQTAMWDHPGNAFSTGFMRGLNRSMARTVVGAYELVTAPI